MYIFNSRGSSLLIVMMALFIFLSLGYAVTAMTRSELTIAANQLHSTQAFYVAEAGLAEAVKLLIVDPAAAGSIISNRRIGEGIVSVSAVWSGNVVSLTSTAKVAGAQRTVRQKMRVTIDCGEEEAGETGSTGINVPGTPGPQGVQITRLEWSEGP